MGVIIVLLLWMKFLNIVDTSIALLVCANLGTCDLWTITNQTAYGAGGNNVIDLMSLIGNAAGVGRTSNDSSGGANYTSGMSNSIISGDPLAFAVDYGDKGMIKGHGRCSTQAGTGIWNGASGPEAVTTMSTLPDSSGGNCYCTLESYTPLNGGMTALSAPWVFFHGYVDASSCARVCAINCANNLWYDGADSLAFRAAMFGAVQ